MQRGDQGKFLENRPKSSPRLKGPQHFGANGIILLISMHLKCKHWRRFWSKKAASKSPNSQVMAIFGRSTKTRRFLKTAKGGPREVFRKSPKSSPRLKGPTSLWRKWHYLLISMHLKCKHWRRFWSKKGASKNLEWPSYGNFRKVTQNPQFLKKCKRGTKASF